MPDFHPRSSCRHTPTDTHPQGSGVSRQVGSWREHRRARGATACLPHCLVMSQRKRIPQWTSELEQPSRSPEMEAPRRMPASRGACSLFWNTAAEPISVSAPRVGTGVWGRVPHPWPLTATHQESCRCVGTSRGSCRRMTSKTYLYPWKSRGGT